MKEKKTEVITIRIPPRTRATIEKEAAKREWTPSKMAEKVLTSWAESLNNASPIISNEE